MFFLLNVGNFKFFIIKWISWVKIMLHTLTNTLAILWKWISRKLFWVSGRRKNYAADFFLFISTYLKAITVRRFWRDDANNFFVNFGMKENFMKFPNFKNIWWNILWLFLKEENFSENFHYVWKRNEKKNGIKEKI